VETLGILIKRVIKNSFQENTRNTLAVFIGLDILTQLKSTLSAKRDPGDD
jgi:hypothetical protein